jgi:Protein of unknown function (DUF3108)
MSRLTTANMPSREPSFKVASFIRSDKRVRTKAKWQYCEVSFAARTLALSPLRTVHRRVALCAVGGVLLAHGLLLGLWPKAPGPGWQAQAARAVQVRQVLRPTPVLALTDSARALVPAAIPPRSQRSRTKTAAAAPPPTPPLSAAVTPLSATLQPAPLPSPDEGAVANNADSTADPGGATVPVFATQLPPPFVLRYTVQRGIASGRAELRWLVKDGAYRLTMQSTAFGAQGLNWSSEGGLDDNGVAPTRYVESRRGRELRALNFQRDQGRITFSGPQLQYPLVAGAQDRLTWMVQLPAVLAANPALAQTGAQVPIFVAGARGDAQVWAFQVLGEDAVDLPDGTQIKALHLRREPRRAYDTQTDVWLDPARHHLPVRALLRVRATGEGTEFLLDSLSLP